MNRLYFHTILFVFIGLNIQANDIDVCATCTHKSVKAGVLNASAGDVIRLHRGVYNEHGIVIDKSLQLIGQEGAVIDGRGEGEIITVTANDVVIENLTIQNVGTSYTEDRAAIRIRKSRNFIIKNNTLRNTFFGIYLEHSRDGKVIGNEIIGEAKEEMSSGNAIHAWYCKNIVVENNRVSHHRDGIYFEFVDKSKVTNNRSLENLRYGLHFMFSNDDDYYKNIFKNNGAGVAVMFSKKINMWENRFEYNWGKASYGLLLKEIYDAEIINNVFLENTIGIYVEGSTRINYRGNDFKQNGWAIKISGGCLDNQVTENNFISNSFDLAVQNNNNQNIFEGNFWSDYTGYDLDKDGVGDVPYRPVKLFNYIVEKTPETMIMMRSLFIDLINFSEKVSPVFTPKNVADTRPSMRQLEKINYDFSKGTL